MYLGLSLVLLLICVGLWRLARSAKLKMKQRALHSRSVAVTIIYSILVVIFFVQVLLLVNKIISIPVVRSFLYYVFPNANASASFYWIITLVLGVLISATFCITIWLCYLLWIKPISKRLILKTKNPIEKFFNLCSSFFFQMQEEYSEITPIAHNIGHWIRYIRNIFGVLLLVESLGISIYLNFNMLTLDDNLASVIIRSLFMLPLLSFFLLDQIVIFLQAEPDENDILIDSESVELTHTGDYSKFIQVYEGYFGGNALISYYVNNCPSLSNSIFSGPDSEQLKRTSNPQLLSAICRNVNNATHPLISNYIDALVDLINGKSVIIFDSFRGEFILYYLAYLQQNLFLRRKALVIAASETQVNLIIEQYKEVFTRINKVHSIWKIESVRSMPNNCDDVDILVCTPNQLFEKHFFEKYKDFFFHLHDVTILDIYSLLCREKTYLLRLFHSLKGRNVQFAFFSEENNADIKKAVMEILNTKEISLYTNHNDKSQVCIMCWREESYYKAQHIISENLYHDFGIGYTIALIACKYDVSRIHIHGHSDIPLNTYASTVKESASIINEDFFNTDRINVESIIQHNPIYAYQGKNLSFDVYYDNTKNLLNAVRLSLSNTATVTSMVHIVSKPYLLRDYFAHNITTLYQNLSGTQMLVPSINNNLTPPCVVLLILLREREFTCEDVVEYMHNFGIEGNNVEELLTQSLNMAFGENTFPNVYNYFSFGDGEIPDFRNDEYYYTRIVKLTNERIYNEAKSIAENFAQITGDCEGVLPINKSIVYNYHLPGQLFNYGGRRYIIVDIINGVIRVRLEETVVREEDYTPYYQLIVQGEPSLCSTVNNNQYICRLYHTNIIRTINGYFSHFNGLDFNSENNNTQNHVLNSPIIEKKKASVIELSIDFPFGKNHERAAALFCILLKGIMETVLPNNYQDIMVVSGINHETLEALPFEKADNSAMREDPKPSDWIEEMDYELPMSRNILLMFPQLDNGFFSANSDNMIHLYIINYNDVDDSVSSCLLTEMDRLLTILRGYMEWVVENPTIPHSFLKLGYNLIPDIFDTEGVNNCLQRIAYDSKATGSVLSGKFTVANPDNVDCCDFCGRPISVSQWIFDDSRTMCEDCYKHRTSERKEVQTLLREAYQTMENLYKIKLPRDIKIRFNTAATIRKAYHSGDVLEGRVIGLYIGAKKEIWIERGGPEACVLSTLIHELTHAWQAEHVNMDKLGDQIIEGHSTFVEIECLRKLGQSLYADFWKKTVLNRNDDYSKGLQYWTSLLQSESDKNIFNHMLKM